MTLLLLIGLIRHHRYYRTQSCDDVLLLMLIWTVQLGFGIMIDHLIYNVIVQYLL